jgi:acetoin:2,6-dichlorophenolindophenol oxidoreductase subunit beta
VKETTVTAPQTEAKAEARTKAEAQTGAKPRTRTINWTQSFNLALHDALAADERVFLMGEDIADEEGGGVFKHTAGLSAAFGTNRVRSTPIAEEGYVAAGIGAAQAGLIPVVDVMLMSVIGLALDTLHNTASKWRYMTGGTQHVPLTVCTFSGAGSGMGGQHSDLLEGWVLQSPGLKVVMPSNAADTYGLLTSCIFDEDPCVFIGHFHLMARQPKAPRPEPGTRVPIGVADVPREGSDVSIIAYGGQVLDALDVAGKLAADGVSAEVVDVRTLWPLDMTTVLTSVAKTKRAVIVHESRTAFGPGAEIAARIYEELYGELSAPVQRVGAPYCPVPASPVLEAAYMPKPDAIEAAVRTTIG